MSTESQPLLTVKDVTAWRAWLDANEHTSDGVWLVLAKKGTVEPTSLSYAEALDEALCSGWIDGQKKSFDSVVFLQRFTPRRKRSIWSLRKTGIVEQLIAQGRMRERGMSEIELAKADGRWAMGDRSVALSCVALAELGFGVASARAARARERTSATSVTR